MTSIRNISRGIGAGVVGLGLAATLAAVSGCGGTSDGTSGFVDPGPGQSAPTAAAQELTRIQYEFGPNGLNVPAGAAFYDIGLYDALPSAGGKLVRAGGRGDTPLPLDQRFTAGSSVQVQVPDDALGKVAATGINIIGTDGRIILQYEIPLTIVKNQTTVVRSATASTPTLSSISLGTSNVQGQLSVNETGRLQASSGQQYPILVLGTFGTGNNTAVSPITSGVTFTVAPANLGSFQDNIFIPGATVAPGSLGNITATFGGQTGRLGVNVTGIAAASPTPTPTPTPTSSPTPAASPTPTPSPGSSPSASPSGTPGIGGVQLFIASTTIRTGNSSTYGINATVNGTSVNITSIAAANTTVTSANTQVILPDVPNQRLNGVGVGTSIVNATVSVPGLGSSTSANFLMTVNP